MSEVRKRHYCTDCDWSKNEWLEKEFPVCSNPKYKKAKNHSHRESDYDRYPFCSHTNSRGYCEDFIQKKMIGSDIMTIIRNLFKGGGK